MANQRLVSDTDVQKLITRVHKIMTAEENIVRFKSIVSHPQSVSNTNPMYQTMYQASFHSQPLLQPSFPHQTSLHFTHFKQDATLTKLMRT